MKIEPVIDMKKALHEKETMQKHFIRENGYKSDVLNILIEHFKEQVEKEDMKKWKSEI